MINPYDTVTATPQNPYDSAAAVAPQPDTAPNPYDVAPQPATTPFAEPSVTPNQPSAESQPATRSTPPDVSGVSGPTISGGYRYGLPTYVPPVKTPKQMAIDAYDMGKGKLLGMVNDVSNAVKMTASMYSAGEAAKNAVLTGVAPEVSTQYLNQTLDSFTPDEKASAGRGTALIASMFVPESKFVSAGVKSLVGTDVAAKVLTSSIHGATTFGVYGALAPTEPGQSRLESIGSNALQGAWQAPIFAGVFKALGWGVGRLIPKSLVNYFTKLDPSQVPEMVRAAKRTSQLIKDIRAQEGIPSLVDDELKSSAIQGILDEELGLQKPSDLDERTAAWVKTSELAKTNPDLVRPDLGLTPPAEPQVPGEVMPMRVAVGVERNLEQGGVDVFGYRGTEIGTDVRQPHYGGEGIFITPLEAYARQFGIPYAVRVHFQNPLMMDTWIHMPTSEFLGELRKEPGFENYRNGVERMQQEIFTKLQPTVERVARRLGYDGIVVAHGIEGTETVAFQPDRVYVAGSAEAATAANQPAVPQVTLPEGTVKATDDLDLLQALYTKLTKEGRWEEAPQVEQLIHRAGEMADPATLNILGLSMSSSIPDIAKELAKLPGWGGPLLSTEARVRGLLNAKLRESIHADFLNMDYQQRNALASQLVWHPGSMRSVNVAVKNTVMGELVNIQRALLEKEKLKPNISVEFTPGIGKPITLTVDTPTDILSRAVHYFELNQKSIPMQLTQELIQRKIRAATDIPSVNDIVAKATGKNSPLYGKVLDLGSSHGSAIGVRQMVENHINFISAADAEKHGLPIHKEAVGGWLDIRKPSHVMVDGNVYKVDYPTSGHPVIRDVTDSEENPLRMSDEKALSEAKRIVGEKDLKTLVDRTMKNLGATTSEWRAQVEREIARDIAERRSGSTIKEHAETLLGLRNERSLWHTGEDGRQTADLPGGAKLVKLEPMGQNVHVRTLGMEDIPRVYQVKTPDGKTVDIALHPAEGELEAAMSGEPYYSTGVRDPSTLFVEYIGDRSGGGLGNPAEAGLLGTSTMKAALRALRQEFPDAKFIGGERQGGVFRAYAAHSPTGELIDEALGPRAGETGTITMRKLPPKAPTPPLEPAGHGVDVNSPIHQQMMETALFHEANSKAAAQMDLTTVLPKETQALADVLKGIEPQPVAPAALEKITLGPEKIPAPKTPLLTEALADAGVGDVDKALLKLSTSNVKLKGAPKGLAESYKVGELTLAPAQEEIAPWQNRPSGVMTPIASDSWAIMRRLLDSQYDQMVARYVSYGRGEGGLPPKGPGRATTGAGGEGGDGGPVGALIDFAKGAPREALVRAMATGASGYFGYKAYESDDQRTKIWYSALGMMAAFIAFGPSKGSAWAREWKVPMMWAKMSDVGSYMRASIGEKSSDALRGATNIFQLFNYSMQAKGEYLSKLFPTPELREALARTIENLDHPMRGLFNEEQLNAVLQERAYNEQLGQFLVERGILDDYRENYIRHIYPKETYNAWKTSLGNLQPGGFTKARLFNSLAEAEAWATKNNLPGPVLDGVQLQVKHGLEVARALSSQQFKNEMTQLGLLIPERGEDGNLAPFPQDWRNPRVQGYQQLRAPDAVATAFERLSSYHNPLFDSGFIKAVDDLRSMQMRAVMMFPWIHALNALRGGLAIDGSGAAYIRAIHDLSRADAGAYRAASYGVDLASRPDFAIDHSELFEKVVKKIGGVFPDAVSGPAAAVAGWMDKALWNRSVPGLALATFNREMLLWTERTGGRFPEGTPEFTKAAQTAADMANTVQGKVPNLMRDPGFALAMRTVFFAPQWMSTRIKITTEALGDIRAIAAGQLDPSEARFLPYKLKTVVVGAALTYLASKLWTGKAPEFNPASAKFYAKTGVKDQNGRELGFDFAGWWQDDVKLWSNPTGYFLTRMNPQLQLAHTVMTGRDTYGRSINSVELAQEGLDQLGPVGSWTEGVARAIISRGQMSDADVLRTTASAGSLGNVATLPHEYEMQVNSMAHRILRNQNLPMDDDRVYELQQIMLSNVRRGQPLISGDVISWLGWQQRAYKKSFGPSYLFRQSANAVAKLVR